MNDYLSIRNYVKMKFSLFLSKCVEIIQWNKNKVIEIEKIKKVHKYN
jgi:hypothetical protein